MKRSDLFIRLMTAIMFLAVAIYGGVILYDRVTNPYQTTTATAYTIEETFKAQGYIVRSEVVLSDFGASVLPIVREGEKVAAGQAIAVEYYNPESLEIAGEIRALTMKIAQLEASGSAGENAGNTAIMNLSAAVNTRDLRRLDEIMMDLETGIYVTETDIQVLRTQLEALQSRTVSARTVHAPISGNFSYVVDGFEHITPSVISDLSPEDLHAHFRIPLTAEGSGKLVTHFKWYYVAEMQYEDAARLSVGQRRTVQFSGAYQAQVEMDIENISRRSGDTCVVLFSSTRGIHEVASLRNLRADVINDVYTGIRIPKEAVHLDNENGRVVEYIFLQTSGYAERVNIERIPPGNPAETADSYLVRDGLENDTPLRVGSTIIVRGSNLYHMKVVG